MSRKLSRSLLLAVAVTGALVAASTLPAQAATGATSAVTGAGGIAPGLTATGGPQTFSFGGSGLTTGVVCGIPEVAVSHTISASGDDSLGTYAAGTGNVTVHVSGNAGCPGGLTLTGLYVREGLNVHVEVSAGTNAAVADCAFVPGQTPPAPVVSYSLTCTAHITGTA